MKHNLIVGSFGTIFICLYIGCTLHYRPQLGVKAGEVEVQEWKWFCSRCESRGPSANVSGYDRGGDLFYVKVACLFLFWKNYLSLPGVLNVEISWATNELVTAGSCYYRQISRQVT